MSSPDPYQYPTQYAPTVVYPGAYLPYPPPRKPRRWPWIIAAALGLLVVLVAVAVSVTPVKEAASKSFAPVKSQSELIVEWQAEVRPDLTDLQNAMQDVADASTADPVNIADLHSACAMVEQSAQQVLNHLPTAHALLAEEILQAMTQYVNAGQSCQHLTPYSSSADVAVVAGFILAGNEHLERAGAIIGSLS